MLGDRLRFLISPEAFFQTNTEMAERLYGAAVEMAGLTGRERVFDLFCGIGTISIALSLAAGEVWGIEVVEEAGRPEVVVVDPPRAGLSQKIVRRILEAEPRRIVYVSCNPTTLAPNARQMADAGYELARVRPVDMFPQTPHIECVALLERSSA